MALESLQLLKKIQEWHLGIDRKMPWKETLDPYKIWISEVILQQTQVAQGLKYYHRFLAAFPTVQALADASEAEVMKQWEGLGYYRRAKNLHIAAQQIVEKHQGRFPINFEDVLALRGIGDYTASAICSFAYDQPYPAIDSNVERIFSRYFGIELKKSSASLKQAIKQIVGTPFKKVKSAGELNQALIDFGALVCKSKTAHCDHCPLQESCYAYANDQVYNLPIKSAKKSKQERYFHYSILKSENQIWISERRASDIWLGLHEFYLDELATKTDLEESKTRAFQNIVRTKCFRKLYKQELTHRRIFALFTLYELAAVQEIKHGSWVPLEELNSKTFPGVIRLFLDENMHNFIC